MPSKLSMIAAPAKKEIPCRDRLLMTQEVRVKLLPGYLAVGAAEVPDLPDTFRFYAIQRSMSEPTTSFPTMSLRRPLSPDKDVSNPVEDCPHVAGQTPIIRGISGHMINISPILIP